MFRAISIDKNKAMINQIDSKESETKPKLYNALSTGFLLIGDVHEKVNEYWKIVNQTNKFSIQVGDFGLKTSHEWFLKNIDCSQHKINFGNHDDHTFLHKPHSLSDFSIGNEYMSVRGAYSYDKAYRIENVDWWKNEELNYAEMQNVVDHYIHNKPKLMITHDCPLIVKQHLFGITDKSMTSNGLQMMFENHQPDIWVFGHHHKSKDVLINGTRFVCLSELETMVV